MSAAAQTPAPSASAEAMPAQPALPPDAELPALPSLPTISPEPIDPEAAKELGHLLAKLVSAKEDIRDAARKDLLAVDPKSVGAIHARIEELREKLDRDRAPRMLADVRKAARKKQKASKDDMADDWLLFLHEQAKPDDNDWRDLVELTSLVRMLGAIGTTSAVREMINLRAQFGDLLRLDISRQIAALKDKAVPALIEAKRHDAVVVQRFAELELDRLGRAIPGEAVAATDPDVLSDVLRSFGYVRDVDAVGVCLSFANHDRKKVREAARQAITGIGEAARWQLRDTYQDLTGEKVDKSVPWDALARRIFFLYDRARIAELAGVAEGGFAAAKAGKYPEAVAAFDKVLARDPLFDKRKEMVGAYFEVAKTIPDEQAEERLATLRKARRLGADEATDKQLEAEIAVTEAKLLIAEGRPEKFLLRRALELDPQNAEAKRLLDSFEEKAVAEKPTWPRFAAAGGAAAGALSLAALIMLLRRKRRPEPKPEQALRAEGDGGD